MEKCLITTLGASVNNSNLRKIGEFVVPVLATGEYTISTTGIDVSIDGGTFTKTSGKVNVTSITASSGIAYLHLTPKYSFVDLLLLNNGFGVLDAKEMEYVAVDNLSVKVSGFDFDKAVFSTKKNGEFGRSLNISGSGVVGDATTLINGLIWSFSASATDYVLDFQNVSNPRIESIRALSFTNVPDGLVGFDNLYVLASSDSSHKYNVRWSSSELRNTNNSILSLVYAQFDIDGELDNYLNNIANCSTKYKRYSSLTDYVDNQSIGSTGKIIRIYGTRTSSSDAAVASLKNNGYTIYVNNVQL